MPIPVVQPFDFNLLELLNAAAHNLSASPPHRPGRFYFDTTLNQLGISTGSAWVYVGAQGAFDAESAQDVMAAMLTGSTGVVSTYNDTTGTIMLTVAANSVTNAMINTGAAISADKLTDGTTNKLLTATERTKLGGIATGATANATDAFLLARANGTGTQSADTIIDGTANKVLTAAEKTKLTGIATGATANSTDAALRDRSSHTGTQLSGTISDFNAAVQARIALTVDAAPASLDTLNELAAAMNDDPNFATTMTTLIGTKAATADLAAVALNGQYASLLNKPLYSQTIGDGAATSFVITHGLNTRSVSVTVSQAATPFAAVIAEVQLTTVNSITVLFATAPTAGQYLVAVQA